VSQLITNGQQTLNAIETQQTAFSRQFVDAQTALGELNTAIDSAVPSLRATLNVAPDLLNATSQESYLLAFLGSKANNTTVLSALDQGLTQGPTSTGGALETYSNGTKPEPIFRVCLANPNGGASSCAGNGYTAPGPDSVPASFNGGQSDMNVLAAWLGD
jgi:hypothetical protein